MKDCLVGSTGFVGTNLRYSHDFSKCVHSTDVSDAYGMKPELLVYAGMRAEKFLAVKFPEKDYAQMEAALENIRKIQPEKLVLISTIDVYSDSQKKNEDSDPEADEGQPYGYHRFLLEKRVRKEFPDALILRLPALFGKNLKKNFLYDFLHVIPSLLTKERLEEVSEKEPMIQSFFEQQDNGFFRCRSLTVEETRELKNAFRRVGFTALNFTDSRAKYQFFPLEDLWGWIEKAMEKKVSVLNITSEPLAASEIYEYLTGEAFENEILPEAPSYDLRTKYDVLFGKKDGYLYNKEEILRRIKAFCMEQPQ